MQVTLEDLSKKQLLTALITLEDLIEDIFSITSDMPCDDQFSDCYDKYEDYLESDVGQL